MSHMTVADEDFLVEGHGTTRAVHDHSARHLVVGQNANSWNQSPGGRYAVYFGDSSSLGDLPLRNAFNINATPGARHVVISAPRGIHPGQTKKVKVKLTKGGNETLRRVQIALQLGRVGPPSRVDGRPSADSTRDRSPRSRSW
jgi:hypothetical protein